MKMQGGPDTKKLLQNAERPSAEDQSLEFFIKNVLFVIVIYKTRLEDSISFRSLNRFLLPYNCESNIDIIIFDNSPLVTTDIKTLPDEDWASIEYIHDKTNPGISKSYNKGAQLAIAKSKKWMLVLDQDSMLPEYGVNHYMSATNKWPNICLYAPKLISNSTIISPCNYYFYRGSNLKNISSGLYSTRGKNVLNSGLLLDTKEFNRIGGYEEEVWLYFSDFVFFNKLKKTNKYFVTVDCEINHELSSSDFSNFTFAMQRFTYYCEGARKASNLSNSVFAFITYCITVGMRAIKMSLRFNSLVFIHVFTKNFLKI